MTDFFVVTFPGMTVGAVYAVLGLGIVLAMRVTRVVNLAQGEFYVVGAMVTSTLVAMGLPFLAAVAAAVVVGAALGAVEESLLLRRMRGASGTILLLTTVAFAISLQGVQVLAWGRNPRSSAPAIPGVINVGGVRMQWQAMLLIALAVLVTAGLIAFLDRSRTGKAMAAVAEDPDGARVTGVDVFRLRLLGLVVAGAIGGLIGAIALPLFLVDFTRGLGLSLRGFVAAVAGRTTVSGTLVAGLAIGAAETLTVRYLSSLFSDVFVFGVLVVIILALPALNQLRTRAAT